MIATIVEGVANAHLIDREIQIFRLHLDLAGLRKRQPANIEPRLAIIGQRRPGGKQRTKRECSPDLRQSHEPNPTSTKRSH